MPETTGLGQAAVGALLTVVVAFAYQRSRLGRRLRAMREDPAAGRASASSTSTGSGSSPSRSRARWQDSPAACTVHLLPLNTETLYLDLTFITLAMLVVGGATSLWGAVVGALAVSGLDSFLAVAENGDPRRPSVLDLPGGTRLVVVGALMALVLVLRPSGLHRGREFRLPTAPRSFRRARSVSPRR